MDSRNLERAGALLEVLDDCDLSRTEGWVLARGYIAAELEKVERETLDRAAHALRLDHEPYMIGAGCIPQCRLCALRALIASGEPKEKP